MIYNEKFKDICYRRVILEEDPVTHTEYKMLSIECTRVELYIRTHYPQISPNKIPYSKYDKEAILATHSTRLLVDFHQYEERVLKNVVTKGLRHLFHQPKTNTTKKEYYGSGDNTNNSGDMVFFQRDRYVYLDTPFVIYPYYINKNAVIKHLIQQAKDYDKLKLRNRGGQSLSAYVDLANTLINTEGLTDLVFSAPADTTVEINGTEIQVFKGMRQNISEGEVRTISPVPLITQITKHTKDEEEAERIVLKLIEEGIVTISRYKVHTHPTSTSGREARKFKDTISLTTGELELVHNPAAEFNKG